MNTAQLNDRRSYVGGSDAPIIMGMSPWRTPFQLWQDKLGLVPHQEENWAMKRGNELEPLARDLYIKYTGNQVKPKQVFHPDISFMMANMDGISDDQSVAVEIKCPGHEDHGKAKEGRVPIKYFPQLQHQLAVIGLDIIHYFSYLDGDFALVEVQRDEDYINELYDEETRFWECVRTLSPPDFVTKDFLENSSEEFLMEAQEYMKWKNQQDIAKKEADRRKENLVKLANGMNSIGNGFKLQQVMKKGNINYDAIPELEGVDLEQYRKKSTTYWKVTSC